MSLHYLVKQDSAPARRARDMIQLLRREMPDFIGPELWPPNSPDLNALNLVDYKIWRLMQERIYQTAIHDVDELKQHLIALWADMKQSVINKAIDEWRSRLVVVPYVRAKGRHFEHLLC